MARRSRGTYPQGYITSEQRRQRTKEPARMFKLFCHGALAADAIAQRIAVADGISPGANATQATHDLRWPWALPRK